MTPKKTPRCCKTKMTKKESYCSKKQTFYVCEICGKEKIVEAEPEGEEECKDIK